MSSGRLAELFIAATNLHANLLPIARYAISDIHGCAKTLRYALSQIQLTKEDELFLLGDYIDRGPDSMGALQFIWELEATGYKVTCLRGNHEQMLIDYHLAKRSLYEWTPPTEHLDRTLDWMNELAHYVETPGYILVHAGLNFDAADPLSDKNGMLWSRYWYNEIDYDWLGERTIVHGHTPLSRSTSEMLARKIRFNKFMDIDAGCSSREMGMGYLLVFDLDTERGEYFMRID